MTLLFGVESPPQDPTSEKFACNGFVSAKKALPQIGHRLAKGYLLFLSASSKGFFPLVRTQGYTRSFFSPKIGTTSSLRDGVDLCLYFVR